MYKLLSFVALFALLAVAFAAEAEKSDVDQEAAEAFFVRYGYYPAGYNAFAYSYGNAGYPYAGYRYAGYPYAFNPAVVPATFKTAGYYPGATVVY